MALQHECQLPGPQHVYVDERRSDERAPGPTDEGSWSCMLMANTTRSWIESYDMRFRKREAQKAVNCMTPWRNHFLTEAAGAATVAPAEGGEGGLPTGSEGAGPSRRPGLCGSDEEDDIVILLSDSDSD